MAAVSTTAIDLGLAYTDKPVGIIGQKNNRPETIVAAHKMFETAFKVAGFCGLSPAEIVGPVKDYKLGKYLQKEIIGSERYLEPKFGIKSLENIKPSLTFEGLIADVNELRKNVSIFLDRRKTP